MGDLLRNSFRNIVIFNLANHTFIRYVLLVEHAIPVNALKSIVQGSTNTKSAPASTKAPAHWGVRKTIVLLNGINQRMSSLHPLLLMVFEASVLII